jgi:hypothetical protein
MPGIYGRAHSHARSLGKTAHYSRRAGSVPSVAALGYECSNGLLGRVAPSNAEGVTGRVSVDLVALLATKIGGCLEQPSAQPHRLFVRLRGVGHVEVDVHLLGRTLWPLGLDVGRGVLHADRPVSRLVDHALELIVSEDASADHSGPEGALGLNIGGVKNGDLPKDHRPAPFRDDPGQATGHSGRLNAGILSGIPR